MQDRPRIRQTLLLMQDDLRKNNQKNIERYREAVKICSFSERLDSLPMWAHYANNHQGFCMEYDIHSFPDEIRENIYPILYTNERERPENTKLIQHVMCDFEDANPDHLLLAMFVKSADLGYEKEWRYIPNNPAVQGGMTYKIGYPKAIYPGNKIREEDAQTNEKLYKNKNIKLARMVLSSTRFGMVSRPFKPV